MNKAELRDLFVYDADQGILYSKRTGKQLKGSLNTWGYRQVRVNGKAKLMHGVIYCYMTGELPEVVDHIDRDRTNNKWENLRATDKRGNAANRHTNNKDLAVGLHKGVQYRAQYWVRGKSVSKTFTISKYGDELAYFLAVIARESFEDRDKLGLL